MSENEDVRGQLLDIIAKEGMIDRDKLTPGATLETIGVASYDMVMILMAIEEKFGVYLSVDSDVTDVTTLDDLLNVLETRIEHQKNGATDEAGDSGEADNESASAADPKSEAEAG
jgi:acyl carrier protein